MNSPATRFHLAFPVTNLAATRRFYQRILGCPVGRESERWIDFDFFGHQITAHLVADQPNPSDHSPVDGHQIPVPHFGAILGWEQFDEVAAQLKSYGVPFLIEPYHRFAGQPGEQKTMFVSDPSGHALEFKAFPNDVAIFDPTVKK
jgi:hypothetical protein